jgi:hypothetical protein
MEIKMSYAAMEKIVVFKLKEHGFDITDINYNHPDYTRTDIHEALENVKITFSVELQVHGEAVE